MHEEERHWLQRWFSMGDAISMIVTLVALGVAFGSLSKDVEVLREDLVAIKRQAITPGAQAELAAVHQRNASQDQQLAELREEMRDQRREILAALDRLEDKLDRDHKAR